MPLPDVSAWSGPAQYPQYSSEPPPHIQAELARIGVPWDPSKYAWDQDTMNLVNRSNGERYYYGNVPDPSLGTDVQYSTGATEHFGPGENPHFFLSAGDNYASQGGVAAAVPGSELYNQLSDDARTRSLQGVARVGALVGGAAALGNTAWGQGGQNALTQGSGTATVSGTNTAAGVAGGADLGGLISAGMGPQGTVAGAGAGGLATGAAAGGLGAKILNWLPEISGGVNALLGYRAADQAADAEVNALNQAIAEQRRQFDLTRSDWQPWMDAGRDALSNLADPANNFLASPGYEWLRTEGQRDIGNSFSARGGAQSGNALRALAEFQTGLAQQDYGNWYNRELARAGLGTTGTSNVTAAGQNAANATSNYLSGQGVSRASGVYGRNAAIAGGVNDIVENVLYRRGRRAD